MPKRSFHQAVVVALLALLLAACPFGFARAASDFLDPSVAFRFSARLISDASGSVIAVRYDIAPGYYMYRDQFRFSAQPPVTLGMPALPPAKIKFDENFGKDVAYYRDRVEIRIPYAGAQPVKLTAVSQGCADAGLCYSPQETSVVLQGADSAGWLDDGAYLATTLRGGNAGTIVLLFYGLGLLLSFTPCMLPMVPILSSAIVGQATSVTRTRGFLLALAYTLGMALVYTGMGVAAGLAGEGFAAYLQNPWVLGASAALLVLFALAMFDVYRFEMPVAVQDWMARRSRGVRGGRFAGVFAMGALSAAIVGPCVAAPLAGALVYISQTRDTLLGGLALFALAFGIGTPLLLIGLSAGAFLPRVGLWMHTLKRFFGVLLFAVAIYLVSPVIPTALQLLAWAALLFLSAALLGAFNRMPAGIGASRWLGKGLGVSLIAGSAVLLALAAVGGDVRPLFSWFKADVSIPVASSGPTFQRVRSVAELDQYLARAGKPVMLDFYADWCVSCKEMERFTFSDKRVAARMAQFQLLQVDVTANTADDRALLKRFALFGPPGILFFDASGNPIAEATVIGFQNADRFLESLGRVPG